MPPFSVPLERWCFPGRTCVTKLEPSGGGPQQRDEFLLLCERVASVECDHQEGAFRFHEVRLRRSVVHLGVRREHRALADAEDLRCPWPTLSDLHEDSLLDVPSAQASPPELRRVRDDDIELGLSPLTGSGSPTVGAGSSNGGVSGQHPTADLGVRSEPLNVDGLQECAGIFGQCRCRGVVACKASNSQRNHERPHPEFPVWIHVFLLPAVEALHPVVPTAALSGPHMLDQRPVGRRGDRGGLLRHDTGGVGGTIWDAFHPDHGTEYQSTNILVFEPAQG